MLKKMGADTVPVVSTTEGRPRSGLRASSARRATRPRAGSADDGGRLAWVISTREPR